MQRQTRYLGVDLPRNCFTLSPQGGHGRGRGRRWRPPEGATFARTLRPTGAVAGEATGNVRWFCAARQARGARLVVVNPHQPEGISRAAKRTDPHDAERLAKCLAKGLLPEVRMQGEAATRSASLAQPREKLVKLGRVLQNKGNPLLVVAQGSLLRQESLAREKGLAAVLAAPVSEFERRELDSLVGEIRRLRQSIAKVEELLRAQGPHLPGWTNLTSITGSGAVGASSLRSPIGTVAAFPSEGKLVASSGIGPRGHASTATERRGHSPQRGAKLGRTALVHWALTAARDRPSLPAFSRRCAATRGTGKASIALARKFLGVMYRTLTHHGIFTDFPRFVLANG